MNRVATVSALLILLGMAACGDDEPAPPAIEVPEWAKVAPEQIAEAKKHGVPVAFENDLGMRFVLIPAGTFLMGSPEDEWGRSDEETERQHEVTLMRPFYMSIYEVTNAQFARQKKDSERRKGFVEAHPRCGGDAQPVAWLDWEDARTFAAWLSSQDRIRTYRLPTEAEWEYACRAGTTTLFSFGDTITTEHAHIAPKTPRIVESSQIQTVPVGTRGHNAWGLFDMHGNVMEWCSDWYEGYPATAVTDPKGPEAGYHRVARGGDMELPLPMIRSTGRFLLPFGECGGLFCGFRLVSPLPERGE